MPASGRRAWSPRTATIRPCPSGRPPFSPSTWSATGAGEICCSGVALGYGRDKAAIAATRGKAREMLLDVPDLVTTAALTDGFEEGLAARTTREIVARVDLATLDRVNGVVEQKGTAALARNPRVDTIFQSTDGLFLTGVQAAILTSGRANELLVIGSAGFPSNLDAMNRAFAGAEQAHGGQGFICVDARTSMPDTGAWDSTVDFPAGSSPDSRRSRSRA